MFIVPLINTFKKCNCLHDFLKNNVKLIQINFPIKISLNIKKTILLNKSISLFHIDKNGSLVFFIKVSKRNERLPLIVVVVMISIIEILSSRVKTGRSLLVPQATEFKALSLTSKSRRLL